MKTSILAARSDVARAKIARAIEILCGPAAVAAIAQARQERRPNERALFELEAIADSLEAHVGPPPAPEPEPEPEPEVVPEPEVEAEAEAPAEAPEEEDTEATADDGEGEAGEAEPDAEEAPRPRRRRRTTQES